MTKIKIDKLTEIKEIQSILSLYYDAINYIEDFDWCVSIKKCWFDKDLSIYKNVGVFLFEIKPSNNSVDKFVWAIVGDLPSAHFDKSVTSGYEAVEKYCELMQEWVDNVTSRKSTAECFKFSVNPTIENAELLHKKIEFIRRELLMKDNL